MSLIFICPACQREVVPVEVPDLIECKNCGKLFERTPKRVTYCSIRCSSLASSRNARLYSRTKKERELREKIQAIINSLPVEDLWDWKHTCLKELKLSGVKCSLNILTRFARLGKISLPTAQQTVTKRSAEGAPLTARSADMNAKGITGDVNQSEPT